MNRIVSHFWTLSKLICQQLLWKRWGQTRIQTELSYRLVSFHHNSGFILQKKKKTQKKQQLNLSIYRATFATSLWNSNVHLWEREKQREEKATTWRVGGKALSHLLISLIIPTSLQAPWALAKLAFISDSTFRRFYYLPTHDHSANCGQKVLQVIQLGEEMLHLYWSP